MSARAEQWQFISSSSSSSTGPSFSRSIHLSALSSTDLSSILVIWPQAHGCVVGPRSSSTLIRIFPIAMHPMCFTFTTKQASIRGELIPTICIFALVGLQMQIRIFAKLNCSGALWLERYGLTFPELRDLSHHCRMKRGAAAIKETSVTNSLCGMAVLIRNRI